MKGCRLIQNPQVIDAFMHITGVQTFHKLIGGNSIYWMIHQILVNRDQR